jgi:ribose/xylose/arabinose/galactoside ABC-type transport system permease subunit
MRWSKLRHDPHTRPLVVLILTIAVLAAFGVRNETLLSGASVRSTLETASDTGLVALGLGLTMMIREFDLSVVGVFSAAGCIAVLTGNAHPFEGLLLALALGLFAGLAQGYLIVRLQLSSIGVTLGGMLVLSGLAYVLSENRSLPYDNMDVALALTQPLAVVFSIRSLLTLALFVVAAFVVGTTRLGRDLIAMGSDRRAATITGVNVGAMIVGVFAFSGIMAALAGGLVSYSLASASPAGLSDVIVPAATAAILGGVSLAGGTGRPLGIAIGTLVLGALHAGLNALGAPPYAEQIAMGAVLLVVAVADGPMLLRRVRMARRWLDLRPTSGVRRNG